MKKLYIFLSITFIALFLSTVSIQAQDERIVSPNRTTLQRTAEGQTEWIAGKFNDYLYNQGINIKDKVFDYEMIKNKYHLVNFYSVLTFFSASPIH